MRVSSRLIRGRSWIWRSRQAAVPAPNAFGVETSGDVIEHVLIKKLLVRQQQSFLFGSVVGAESLHLSPTIYGKGNAKFPKTFFFLCDRFLPIEFSLVARWPRHHPRPEFPRGRFSRERA